MRYLPKDSTIPDFDCGPADKTVVSLLGYRCTGSCHHMTEKKRFAWIIRRIYEAATLLFPSWRDDNPPNLEALAPMYAD